MTRPARILVTGANGLVGSRLCAQLSAAGHEVVGLGRGERRAQGAALYLSCNLGDADAVRAGVAEVKPEAIIHCASMTHVDGCESNREGAFTDNVLAAKNIARAAAGVEAHLVYVSTDYVFDGDKGPYTEEDLPNPRGAYAITKLMGEAVVKLFSKPAGWAIARTAVVYGYPPGPNNNFGTWLAGSLSKGEKIKLFEDQLVSPSLASNVAAMLGELALKRETGIWNICGAEVVDRVTFGRRLCAVFGFDSSLITPTKLRDLNLASPRPLKSGLVVDKAASRLQAKPLSIDEALKQFQAEYRPEREGRAP